jgi:iron complex outermembrane receptor protein
LASVERIEILSDGASAIYGSDAIGGVVNIITRKDFNGVELSVGMGDPKQ